MRVTIVTPSAAGSEGDFGVLLLQSAVDRRGGERGNFSQDTATLLWSQAIMQSVLEQEQGMFADIIRWFPLD